ncbi:hypothetical protein GCM10009845_39210 [Pedococcus bigeumensis]
MTNLVRGVRIRCLAKCAPPSDKEAAALTELPASTLRCYESIGVIELFKAERGRGRPLTRS